MFTVWSTPQVRHVQTSVQARNTKLSIYWCPASIGSFVAASAQHLWYSTTLAAHISPWHTMIFWNTSKYPCVQTSRNLFAQFTVYLSWTSWTLNRGCWTLQTRTLETQNVRPWSFEWYPCFPGCLTLGLKPTQRTLSHQESSQTSSFRLHPQAAWTMWQRCALEYIGKVGFSFHFHYTSFPL